MLAWPDLKVPKAEYRVAEVVSNIASGQQVLVPEEIAVWVVTFREHAHPVLVRKMLRHYFRHAISLEESEWRQEIYDYLTGQTEALAARSKTEQMIRDYGLRVVVIPHGSVNAGVIRSMLGEARFTSRSVEGYEIWCAPGERRQ